MLQSVSTAAVSLTFHKAGLDGRKFFPSCLASHILNVWTLSSCRWVSSCFAFSFSISAEVNHDNSTQTCRFYHFCTFDIVEVCPINVSIMIHKLLAQCWQC